MKKNFLFVTIFQLSGMIIMFLSIYHVAKSNDFFRWPALILFISATNFVGSMASGGVPGYVLYHKNEFKIKKYIIFDFGTYPHIPVRLLLLQLINYFYLFLGALLVLIFWGLWNFNAVPLFDWFNFIKWFSIYYASFGGLMTIGSIGFKIYEFTRYSGEFYVDINNPFRIKLVSALTFHGVVKPSHFRTS